MTPKELIGRAVARGLVIPPGAPVDVGRACGQASEVLADASPRIAAILDRHRLSEDDVREIRRRHSSGDLLAGIASKFGISKSYASLIATRQRKVWVE
jgi:hypothetical protein